MRPCRTTTHWLLVCAILLPLHMHAQDAVPLQVPGLDGANVKCLQQDDLGALWIGTDRGILRFDGAATEHYVSTPTDARSLQHDVVYDLLTTRDGTLWVANAGGVLKMHTRTAQRERVPFLINGVPSTAEVLHLAASASGHWAFCGAAGVFKLAPGDTIHRPVITTGGPARIRAGGGWEAPDGTLWYVDRMALRHWMPAAQREEVFACQPFGAPAPPKTLLLNVVPDAHDTQRLWITSWGLGLLAFDMRTKAFTPHVATHPLSDLCNIVQDAVQADKDTWYFTMDGRLHVLDARTGGPPRPLPGDLTATAIIRTAHSGFAVGGRNEMHVLPRPVTGITAMRDALSNSNVHAAGALDGDGYWAVRFYADRQLMRLNADGSVRSAIALPADTLPYEAFQVLVARNGDVWLGTTKGLMRHIPGTSVIAPFPLRPLPLAGKRTGIADLLEDAEGRIWATIKGLGVVRVDAQRNEQVLADLGGRDVGFGSLGISPFDSAHLLLSIHGHHPLLIHMGSAKARSFVDPTVPVEAFAGVEGVVMQADGRPIFYAYSHGLKRLHDPDMDGLWSIDREWHPPARPGFSSAVRDRKDRIWFGTDRGVLLLDPATGVLHPLDALHGVEGQLAASVVLLPDGDVLVAGNPHRRFTSAFAPTLCSAPLVLRSLKAGGVDLTLQAQQDSMIPIGPQRSDLALAFGRVALLDGDEFTYAYRLISGDAAGPWIDLGRQRSMSLAGLGPGEHRIELRSEGTSAPVVTRMLRVHVMPAWWATWWFRLAVVVMAVALGVLVTRQVLALRYRRRVRELERQRELERVRMRIARDVHDGIGSGLTKITMMLRNVPGADPAHAQRIARASSELVHELGEIVWTVDPRNDDVASFVAFVRSTLGRQAEGLPVELVSTLSFDPAMAKHTLSPDVKRNVLLVMREAVNNALKHSGGDRIEVQLDIRADALRLSVRDNGRGFDPASPREGGNGLYNFRKRAEELGGAHSVHSAPTGTTVHLLVPLTSTNMGA